MYPNWRRKHPDMVSSDARDPPDCFAQVDFFRSRDGHRAATKATSDQRSTQHCNQIFNREGANTFFFEADHREKGERVKRVAEVVQHVVAKSMDHAGPEHRVINT